jgi:hypothetical protein
VTRSELTQRTLRRLAESTSEPVAVTEAEVIRALDEGQRLFAAISLSIERTDRFDLTANQVWYQASVQLPDFFVPLRCAQRPLATGVSEFDVPTFDEVTFDEATANAGAVTRVKPARLAELDALDREWQNARSNTTLRYGVVGFELLFAYPAPSAAGVSLEMTYAATPRDLTSGSQSPDIPSQYHQFLIDYALPTLRLNDGGAELERSVKGLTRFLDAAEQCADTVRARSKTLQYDREPFELRAFDRSRLIGEVVKKRKRIAA